jgi:plasmid stability protein
MRGKMAEKTSAEKLMIRLPEGLRKTIKVSAAENERTMNAEVIYHLRRAYGVKPNEKADATA